MFSALMRRDANALRRLGALPETDQVRICTITRGEILYGLGRLPSGRRRSALEADAELLLAQIPCEPIPEAAADHYARIKLAAAAAGVAASDNDLWIAATAAALGAIVVTTDADFGRKAGVPVEDWAQ